MIFFSEYFLSFTCSCIFGKRFTNGQNLHYRRQQNMHQSLTTIIKDAFSIDFNKAFSRYLPRGEKLSKSNALIYMKFSLYEIVITPTLIMIVWSTLMHLLRWFITYITLMKNLHKLVLPTVLSNSIYKNRTEQNNHN